MSAQQPLTRRAFVRATALGHEALIGQGRVAEARIDESLVRVTRLFDRQSST